MLRTEGFLRGGGIAQGTQVPAFCRMCTPAPLIADISSTTPTSISDPQGEQQSGRPRLVPSSNTSSKSRQLGARSKGREGKRGQRMQLLSNQAAETAVQQAQAGTQALTSQPISTLYLMLMFPSNRMHKSACHTLSPHIPPPPAFKPLLVPLLTQ